MSVYVDVHTVTPLGPNNLNRDGENAPKTITYGGCVRHRLSSQSQKYAVRGDFIDTYGDAMISLRSRSLVSLVSLRIQEADPSLSVEEAHHLAARALTVPMSAKPKDGQDRLKKLNDSITSAAGKAADELKKNPNATIDPFIPELSATFQISDVQARKFASEVVAAVASGVDFSLPSAHEDKNLTAKLTETLRECNTADVLLFGRMMAANTDLSVDAVCQVAHAVGVSEYAGDMDLFIAADEVSTRNTELADAIRNHRGKDFGGADMLDTKGIAAGSLYRYANVNVTALAESAGSTSDAADITAKFVASFATTLPGGAQNSHAARSPFSTLIVTVRSTSPMSLVGAFESPVRNADEATEALAHYAKATSDMYGDPVGDKVFVLTVHNRDGVVELLGADKDVSSLPALTEALSDALNTALVS